QILSGNLNEAFDVIVFPDDSTEMIVGGGEEIKNRLRTIPVPEDYRSGIGDVGVEYIKAFVENGGSLITINRACEFAIEKLGLQMRNMVQNKPSKEFFCPGSTLHVQVDASHPLGYGMPSVALALFWDSPVFSIDGSHFNDRYHVVVSYPERDILQSGWLVGEEHLSNRAAVVSVQYGKGHVLLYGIRVQFRATTHGTFKLLFNGLLGE
ncbi:MAG: peptidase M14 family protein, partial [Candidatus Poribacteria bacterium]|nr:peptidase M14 family protein [Candidatus Poribacteria bacterium]